MLKPKSQTFKVKFHLAKVQAVNNKVNSRVHAYLHIDNEQLQFKGSPQLKKNIAIFGSDLEYENFMINYDEITGLYEQKKVLLVIEFETQGAYIKIGEVSINVGEILNDKKYRVVNVYPLSKCYDKSAKVKLAVDFIPGGSENRREGNNLGGSGMNNFAGNANNLNNKMSTMNQVSFKQSNMMMTKKQQLGESKACSLSGGFYKNPTGAIKSRLAEQENVILQQRIYEYEKRMDNYRIAQNELSERMQEQLERKDQKISEISLELSKQQNTIHLITLQNESFKTQIKQLNEQCQLQRLQTKSHLQSIESLQKLLASKEKELQAKGVSLQNLSRTKEHKQKHLSLQIQKYTSKYSQSQQQRNKIIFQLQNKLKLELQKKDQHYQELINSNEGKFLESMKAVKERNKFLEQQYKEMEELTEQQDNRIKSLTLELEKSTSLTQQQQEQMVYLNQQLTKAKKQRQTINNELDSINFSYQETVTELSTQKQLTKQLTKKLQLLKTELSLSNQTIEQQRQRITIMNKDLQVHGEREYYMKEHYEEELYDREVEGECLRGEKEGLLGQLKRAKEQLKLNEEKTEEEQTKTEHLRSTIESLEKELISKNNTLMKLGEDKLYLQTDTKNAKLLIAQLQQQLTKLQQQKAYLSQALMQKKLSLQNDKSLEWTYKIESLQNDIQLMVDKFKGEKEMMKESHKKEEAKRVEEIARLSGVNKKLREEVDDVRDKLGKREGYVMGVEKAMKTEKEKAMDYQRQLASIKETYRLVINEKQNLEQSLKQLTRVKESQAKILQETQKRSQKYKKDLSQIKNGFNRLISMILQYMVKRYNQRTNFQDISLDILVDGEIVSYVNVALKKFCDDHNKTREMIKELEEFRRSATLTNGDSMAKRRSVHGQNGLQQEGQELYEGQDYEQNNRYRKANLYQYQSQENIYMYNNNNTTNNNNNNNKRSFNTIGNNQRYPNPMSNSLTLQSTSPFNTDPIKELETFRSQVDRLKKQQSEYKVKIKTLQEEIEKCERMFENQRFQLNRVKVELEEAHDQVARVGFVVRKKDKIIKELEGEVQEMQKEVFDLRASPSSVIEKAKEKLASNASQGLSENPSLPLIRDLQSKLNLKSQQLTHVQRELESLREQYLVQLNEVKKLETKVKEKSAKILSLQKELDSQSLKRTDDKDKEIIRLKKMFDKEIQEREKIQEKVTQLENVVKEYELQVSHLQNRNKELHDQIKLTEQEFRRNLQSNEYLLNDKSTLYETQILQLKSQLSQQHDKCVQLSQKHSHLTLTLSKKCQQLQHLKEKLSLKEKDFMRLAQELDEEKNRMILKVNGLNDRIRELETVVEGRQFQLEECKFAYEGRVLELERQMDQFRDGLVKAVGPNSAR